MNNNIKLMFLKNNLTYYIIFFPIIYIFFFNSIFLHCIVILILIIYTLLFNENFLNYLFIFILITHIFFYQLFTIPSSSMKPGLQIGDYFIVKKFAYSYNNSSLPSILSKFKFCNGSLFFNIPKRGDIVVFLLPKKDKTYYIKRIIGLPGDEIQIKNGILYINNISTKKNIKEKKKYSNQNNRIIIKSIIKENLPSNLNYFAYKRNKKNFTDNFNHNDTFIYKVPKGHYFAMGDNRDDSTDSRFLQKLGYISKNKILGKARVLITNFKINRSFKEIG